MPTGSWSLESQHEAIREIIGHALKARYELPTEVPPQMFALLLQLREQDHVTDSATAHCVPQQHQPHIDRRAIEVE